MPTTSVLTAVLVLAAPPGDNDLKIHLTSPKRVEVVGLEKAQLQKLTRVKWSTDQWLQLLAVYVDPPNASPSDDRPAVLGSHKVDKDALLFVPRFPFVQGVRYRVTFDPRRLPGGAKYGKPIVAHVLIPKPSTKPTTIVEQVYPTQDKLPANLLKFYFHFSAPMSQKECYYHVELLDAAGKPVKLPFLELEEGLWSPDGKRYTQFFDPGRLKRGVKPLEDLGPALVEGTKQTLVIHKTWLDANGNPLKSTYRKRFTVMAPDRKSPVLKDWKITVPKAETKQPLKIRFDEPLDHALVQRMIWIVDERGRRIDGVSSVSNEETAWTFIPDSVWRSGSCRLMVDGQLEDLAGNSLAKPFEVDLTKNPTRSKRPKTLQRSFSIQ